MPRASGEHHLVFAAIDKAIKEIKTEEELVLEPRVEKDNVSGGAGRGQGLLGGSFGLVLAEPLLEQARSELLARS